jgi:hypothetical protein
MADTPLKPADAFDAARMLVEVLKALKPDEQVKALRWAQESLGMDSSPPALAAAGGAQPPPTPQGGDIRSFIEAKNPRSDVQFAAAVAYYYAFVAPTRKPEITGTDLQEATRLANRDRLHKPILTLHNAANRGYLDKGSEKGAFKINTVGENLVAMSLPTTGATAARPPRAKAKARKSK